MSEKGSKLKSITREQDDWDTEKQRKHEERLMEGEYVEWDH